MFPKVEETILITVANTYTKYMQQLGMDTCWQKAHFFAQAAVESGEYLYNLKGEKMVYSRSRLCSVFFSRVYSDTENKIFKKGMETKLDEIYAIEDMEKRKETIANLVFNDKYGVCLGNKQDGDGWRYRGSGLVQLTGRGNFTNIHNLIKPLKKVVPDILTDTGADLVRSDIVLGTLTSMAYFKFNRLNEAANGFGNAMPLAKVVGNDVKNGDAKTNHGVKNNFFQNNSKKVFLINQRDWGSIDGYNIPEKFKDKIEIVLNRTRNMKDRTVRTISVDGGVIECYSLERDERPPEKELEKDSQKRIRASICRFEINQASKDKPQHVFASLRLDDKDVPGTRSGILMHTGPAIKGGWTQGCILPNPNKPDDDLKNKYVDSLIQVNKIVEYVQQREKISKRLGIPIASIERKIIIKQDKR